jgi:AGZA family xanthine/uracil permease-like MFS transporter
MAQNVLNRGSVVTSHPPRRIRPSPFQAAAETLDRFFHFHHRGSNVRTEVLAGLTTFSTLSYILIVNPMIMAQSGMDHGALITATAVVGAVFTILMGLWTNYPLAMAPAMGVNAMIAIQICQQMRIPWQAALGMVFYSGVLFFIISVTGLRKIVIESFPDAYKKIIAAGIGFFIAFLGLRNGGLLVGSPQALITMGDFSQPRCLLAFFGIILTVAAIFWRIPGALILSIFTITFLGLFIPDVAAHSTITPWPSRIFDLPNSMGKVFGQLDLVYFWHHLNQGVPIILAILFGDLFSAVATLLAVGRLAHLNDAHGNLPKLGQALMADSTAAMGAAILGTNTPVIYIESAAGVEQGGRTGLVSIVVATCYLLALFLTPLIAIIPAVATTPALVIIGIFAATAVVTILIMALGSSANGVAIGFIVCILMTMLVGKARTLKPAAYVLLGIFVLHYIVP